MGAAWTETEYQNIILKRGQIATTIPKIAEQSGLTVRQARTVIDRLKSTGKVTVKQTNRFSIITLIEYDCNSETDRQNGSPMTGKCQASDSLSLLNTDIQMIRIPDNARAREGGGSSKALKNALETGFERFWSAYPKKTAKQNALKAWQKLRPDEELTEKILSALERHKKSDQWLKDNGQFIPYPATWLNGKRWEDDIVEVNNNAINSGHSRSEEDWLKGFTG